MVRSVLLSCCVAGALSAAAPSQRSPFFATVLGVDGQPIAGSEITCVFTPDGLTPGSADVVVATADSRGRARCDLQVGRLYSAWAVGPTGQDGACYVSDVIPFVASGRVFELRALDRRVPRTVQIAGHEAWRLVGATGVRWYPVACEDAHQDLAWPVRDAIVIPPSPVAAGVLALTDSMGELLVTARVEVGFGMPFEFAPPMEIVAKAVDADGRALPGVRIEHRVLPRSGRSRAFLSIYDEPLVLRVAGTTGADGCLRFHAPVPQPITAGGRSHATTLPVLASKEGFETGVGEAPAAGEVAFMLRHAGRSSLQVASPGSAVLELAAFRSFPLKTAQGGMMVLRKPIAITAEGDACWTLSPAGKEMIHRLLISGPVPTRVFTDWIRNPQDKVTLDLASMPRVEVRVLDESGNPTASALGVFRSARGAGPFYWEAVLHRDVRGCAALHVSSEDMCVYATTGTAHALALVPAHAGPLTLQLEPVPTMNLRILDAEGKPVEGARVVGDSATFGSPSTDQLGGQWDRVGCEFWWSCVTRSRSGGDGVMLVPAFVRKGLTAMVSVRTEKLESSRFRLVPGSSEEVVLRD